MEATERKRVGLRAGWVGLLLAACAGPAAHPIAPVEPTVAPPPVVAETPPPPEPVAPEPVAPTASGTMIVCGGPAVQGGAILCATTPGAAVAIDDRPTARAGADGLAVIGLTRTAPAQVKISARPPGSDYEISTTVDILPRHDTVTSFSMECTKIAPQSPADKRKAEIAWVKKDNALKSFNDPQAAFALQGPVRLDGVSYSSSFGATRTYVPRTKDCEPSTSVHNGTDIAVGAGTDIRAPMAGTVILADPDLFYEGGCVFLDLGRGLVSVTMHMSRIDVKGGDRVEQGQLLGLSGATGRVTGPHLHWAIKYRNVFSDDRGADIWLDPMLLMGLKFPG